MRFILKVIATTALIAICCLALVAAITTGIAIAAPVLARFAGPMSWATASMLTGPLVFVAVVCAILLFAILVAKVLGTAMSGNGQGVAEDDARLMQELHQGLSRLEERVDALETLLLDADRPQSGRERSRSASDNTREDGGLRWTR